MSAAEIKKITESALTLSDAFGYDVTRSAQAAQQMIRNGLVRTSEEAFDVIAYGAQNGIDKSEDLLDTFNEYSVQFRALGINAQQALGLMGQGLRGGARDADTVADALKEFAIRAVDGSKASAKAYQALGLDSQKMTAQMAKGGTSASAGLQLVLTRLRSMKDPVARNAAAVGLFGTKAEDLKKSLFGLNLNTATQGMDKLSGSAKRAGDAMYNNAGAKLEAFKRSLIQGFVNIVGGMVIPALSAMIGWLTAAGGWFQKNAAWLTPLVVGLGTFAAVILTVVLAQKVWIASTAAVRGAWLALNASIIASPIGLIIAGILALVAVLVYLWVKCAGFRNFWIAVWNGIKGAAGAVGRWFAGPFASFFVRAYSAIKSGTSAAVNWVRSKWNAFLGALTNVKNRVGSIFSAIGKFIAGAFSRATGVVRGAINGVIGIVNGAVGALNRVISTANKLPGVSIPHIPRIPRLASGGIVNPTSGGRPVIMGDGGEVEVGLPQSTLNRLLNEAGLRGGGGTTEIRLVVDGGGIIKNVTKVIRLRGGTGDVIGLTA